MVIVVMGPAGSGKTTVGRALADAFGCRFIDADDLHLPTDRDQIHRGVSLTDEQRAPWLAAVAGEIANAVAQQQRLIVACSALRRSYRDLLRPADGPLYTLTFVYLKVSRVELARRITTRTDHFASPTILASQLATLEEPAADETDIFTIAADHSVEDIVETVRRVTFRNTR